VQIFSRHLCVHSADASKQLSAPQSRRSGDQAHAPRPHLLRNRTQLNKQTDNSPSCLAETIRQDGSSRRNPSSGGRQTPKMRMRRGRRRGQNRPNRSNSISGGIAPAERTMVLDSLDEDTLQQSAPFEEDEYENSAHGHMVHISLLSADKKLRSARPPCMQRVLISLVVWTDELPSAVVHLKGMGMPS
jgi:hypothetical protein